MYVPPGKNTISLTGEEVEKKTESALLDKTLFNQDLESAPYAYNIVSSVFSLILINWLVSNTRGKLTVDIETRFSLLTGDTLTKYM